MNEIQKGALRAFCFTWLAPIPSSSRFLLFRHFQISFQHKAVFPFAIAPAYFCTDRVQYEMPPCPPLQTTEVNKNAHEGQFCDLRRREIPDSVLLSPEGEEYTEYFIGLECFKTNFHEQMASERDAVLAISGADVKRLW